MATVKKRILILVPSLVGGGAERALVNLLRLVDYEVYEIDLVVVSFNGVYKEQIPGNVKLIPLFRNDKLVRLLAVLQKDFGLSLIFKWQIRRRIRSCYDTAICYLDSNFTDLLFFVRAKKLVSWVHASYSSYGNFARFYSNDSYRRKVIEQRYSKLDVIAFVSNDARSEFQRVFGEYNCMPVVYNIINVDEVVKKSNVFVPDRASNFSFLAIGSLFPVKAFDRLIEAARIVKDQGLNFKLDILGVGFLRRQLESQIAKLGLSNEVRILGFKMNPYPYLKHCDVFVMSSVSEALPTALCEAMVLGKPVLVTDCSGCKELVANGEFGMMVRRDDAHSLAEGMIRYLTDRRCVDHYSQLSKQRAMIFNDQKALKLHYEIFCSVVCILSSLALS